MKQFLKTLTDNGWNFIPVKETRTITNSRLAKAPAEFREFVMLFDTLANEDDTAWFLSLKDYETEPEDDGFAWNEFEKECIESAEDEGECKEIADFWKNVLPIAISVGGQYSYLGIVLDGDDRGKIVYGSEPVCEETETVCDSFAELLKLFPNIVSEDGDENSVLCDFI